MSSNWNTVNGGDTMEQQEEIDVNDWNDWLEAEFGDCLLDQVQNLGHADWSLFPNRDGESELPANSSSNGEVRTAQSAGPSHGQQNEDQQRRLEELAAKPAFQHFVVRRLNTEHEPSCVALPGRWRNPFELPQPYNGLGEPSNGSGAISETWQSPNYPFRLEFSRPPALQEFSPQVFFRPQACPPLPELPPSGWDVSVNPFDVNSFKGDHSVPLSSAATVRLTGEFETSPRPRTDSRNVQYQQYLVTRSPLTGYLRQRVGEYEQEQERLRKRR